MLRPLYGKQAIARDQGVSRQTVHAWMTDPRWTLGQTFPIDGEQIDTWRAATLDPSPTPGPAPFEDAYAATRKRVDLQHRAEQALMLRQRRGILDNKYILRTIHERAMVGLVYEFRRRLDEWMDSLPPIMVQQDEIQIRKLLQNAYDRMLDDMWRMSCFTLPSPEDVRQRMDEIKRNAALHRHHG